MKDPKHLIVSAFGAGIKITLCLFSTAFVQAENTALPLHPAMELVLVERATAESPNRTEEAPVRRSLVDPEETIPNEATADLLAALAEGDGRRVAALVERHGPGIFRAASSVEEPVGGGEVSIPHALVDDLAVWPSWEVVSVDSTEKAIADMTQDEMKQYLRTLRLVESYPMRNVPLHLAIQSLSEVLGLNYFAPVAADFPERVTLRVEGNPFVLLEDLAEVYQFEMVFERGIWRFFRLDPYELITRFYTLRHRNLDEVVVTAPSINNQLGGGGGGGDGGAGSEVFSRDVEVILEDLRGLLGLSHRNAEGAFRSLRRHHSEDGGGGLVRLIPERNQIMVIATAHQHNQVASFLTELDQPAKLVRIAANFVETSRDPARDWGIDWTDIMGVRISMGGAGSSDDGAGGATIFNENGINLNRSLRGQPFWAQNALLSTSEMGLALNFINSDSNSAIVQDPTVVTLNNRDVSLRFVSQEPVLSGVSSSTAGGVGQSEVEISYVEIGTIISLLPQIVDDSHYRPGQKAVKLHIAIVVSSKTGERVIAGNPYPVISSRTYRYSVTVPDGFTLAIGGLRERKVESTEIGVPGLSRIPFLGGLFRSESERETNTNLIAFITPEILDAATPELRVSEFSPSPSLHEARAAAFQNDAVEDDDSDPGLVRRRAGGPRRL